MVCGVFFRRLSTFLDGIRLPSRTSEILKLPENQPDVGLLHTTIHNLDTSADPDTYASLLRQCSTLRDLSLGQILHEKISKRRFDGDTFLGNLLVQMYGSCGDVDSAKRAFEKIKNPNVFSGNVMLAAYAQNGYLQEAREFFKKLPDPNVVSWNSIMAAYGQHGDVYQARRFFDSMPVRNVVSWNSMIAAYAQNAYSSEALRLFKLMDLEGMEPNKVSFVSALDACGNLGALKEGRIIYEKVLEHDCEYDTAVATALINMFGKCGLLSKAEDIFNNKAVQRNAITWTTMVSVYAHNGQLDEAQKLFSRVPRPTIITWNVLMSAYAQHGHIEKVLSIFNGMNTHDDVSWSTLVYAYVQCGQMRVALDLFKEMDLEGYGPTKFTYMNVVECCGKLSALREGRVIHSTIENTQLYKSDVTLVNNIMNMYSRCGSVFDTLYTFNTMTNPDSVSWSILISALAHNGHGNDALETFVCMNHLGEVPDDVTFLSVISLCAHSGLLRDGRKWFLSMVQDYGVSPTVDHYSCMVDLFCRSGRLAEAEELLDTMPFEPYTGAYITLLGSCKTQGDLKRAARVGRSVLKTETVCSAPYALLWNVYADAKRVNEARIVKKVMEDKGIKKQTGYSYIEVYGRVNEFKAGETNHPKYGEIITKLDEIRGKMVASGYVSDTKLVTYDLEEEDKESVLMYHSEKLAIAYGLLSTPEGTEIRVVKNLRICSDCHAAVKFISKVTSRKIVVRDHNQFHHFESGKCSCNDYW